MRASITASPGSLPKWVKPQLCKLVDAAPQGPEWLHEIKYDGYRMHARLDRGGARLLTRTGLDWTHKYRAIAAVLFGSASKAGLSRWRALRHYPGWEDLVRLDPDGLGFR
jgi:ATP-dependent DNA ligase